MGNRKIFIQNQRGQSVKEGTAGPKDAMGYNEIHRRAVRIGNAVGPSLPNNYSSAQGQLYSLERRFQRDPKLNRLYQKSIDTDVENELVKILDESKLDGTFGKEWYLLHHPVLNPNKPGKVRHVCNAASKYKEVCLNDKLLAERDLQHGLIGTIVRFREGAIALAVDIESMFLQVEVPKQDRSCLRFLRPPRTSDPVQI